MSCRSWLIPLGILGVCGALSTASSAQGLGFEVPEGFEVTLYADDSLATDIFALTIDARGRVVVAGKGYIKVLHDTDGDGKADKATLFADFPKSGAHGMYFDGNDLICDGDKGVRRLHDTDGDGKCDKVSPIWFPTKNDGEHAANGIVRGPDGCYYLITGNDAAVGRDHISSPASPVKDPNAGVVLRFSPDGKTREIVAHGFRNPYDLDFNHLGQMFTVDADGERVHHMPYYAPNRLFDIGQGRHHGWLLPGWGPSWSRPPWWPDNVERLVEIGRGSPTGVLTYRHRAFPARYRNGVFSLCWTFGRVYFFPLERSGSTYDSKMEIFMRTTGDVGFAPTDMDVGPDGDLFVSIGGRGTRGSVFRVRYKGASPTPAGAGDPLRAVLAADQPLSSWSRERWVPAARRLGKEVFAKALEDEKLTLEEHLRSVEILTELFGGVTPELAEKIGADKNDPELGARALWSVSRSVDSPRARAFLATMTSAADPRVARASWEALACLPTPVEEKSPQLDWQAGLESTDRRVRAAAVLVAKGPGRTSFLQAYAKLSEPSVHQRLAYLWIHELRSGDGSHHLLLRTCLDITSRPKEMPLRMEAIRLLQIALGDVKTDEGLDKAFAGYVARSAPSLASGLRRQIAVELAKSFPSGYSTVDLELARLFGMLGEDVPGLLGGVSSKWSKESSPGGDIHYLLCFAGLPGKRSLEVTQKTAAALNGIHIKLAARGAKPSDQVPMILEKLLERLVHLDPELPAALVARGDFGMPGHVVYANKLPLKEQQTAARKLLAGLGKLEEDQARAAWSPELVQLVTTLPEDEALPVLRAQFADPRLSDTVTLFLAEKRRPEDRPRLVEALSSTQPAVVSSAADALVALVQEKPAAVEIGKAVRALRRLETQKVDGKSRQALTDLLLRWTGQKIATEKGAAPWVDWFAKTHPTEAASLPGLGSADFATWKKRFDKIDWDQADVRRGEAVYQRKNCFRCHGDARRLGPDLTGVAQRFSRDDLFTAIIDPNKDISPAYKATTVITHSGKVYSGMIIYSSPDLYLLQTTPDTTARIPREELQLVQPSAISFMPTGLLDDLQDRELADLYSFMKTLRKQ